MTPHLPKTLAGLLAGAALILPMGPAAASSAAWREVGLPFELAHKIVSDGTCRRDEARFLACAHAIDAALAHRDPRLAFTPADASPAGAEVVARFGPAAVVRLAAPRLGALPSARRARAIALAAAWKRTFAGAPVPFGQALAWFEQRHVTPELASELTAVVISGFLQTFKDPVHRLVPRREDEVQLASGGVARVGVGLALLNVAGAHVVERALRDGPAAEAGVRIGDVLLRVDGWPVGALSGPQLRVLLSGPAGSRVRLDLRRGGRPLTVTVARRRVEVPHAYGRRATRLGEADRALGYLRIQTFMSEKVCEQARRALEALVTRTPEAPASAALVLDLVGNEGGLLEEARCLGELLLPKDTLVATLRYTATQDPDERIATRRPPIATVPVVVLADATSASASEALAGALQVAGRALVAGQRTFGKATLQGITPWSQEVPVNLWRTVARYELADDRAVDLVGVAPDVPVARDGRLGRLEEAARMDLTYLEALRPVPPDPGDTARAKARRKAATPVVRCAETRREGWRADGEPVGPRLASALALASCLADGVRPEAPAEVTPPTAPGPGPDAAP